MAAQKHRAACEMHVKYFEVQIRRAWLRNNIPQRRRLVNNWRVSLKKQLAVPWHTPANFDATAIKPRANTCVDCNGRSTVWPVGLFTFEAWIDLSRQILCNAKTSAALFEKMSRFQIEQRMDTWKRFEHFNDLLRVHGVAWGEKKKRKRKKSPIAFDSTA